MQHEKSNGKQRLQQTVAFKCKIFSLNFEEGVEESVSISGAPPPGHVTCGLRGLTKVGARGPGCVRAMPKPSCVDPGEHAPCSRLRDQGRGGPQN